MILRLVAILGAVAAAVLFFMIQGEKQLLQADLDTTRGNLQQTERQLDTTRGELEQSQQQAQQISGQLAESQANVASLQNDLRDVRRELAQAMQVISARDREAEELRREEARIRSELLAARSQAEELRETIEGADPQQLRDTIRALEENLRRTEERIEALDVAEVGGEQPNAIQERRPALRGSVTGVGPRSAYIVINVGAEAGLRSRSPLMIRRGSRYVAHAEVTEVHSNMAIAHVEPGARRIRQGDAVITLN